MEIVLQSSGRALLRFPYRRKGRIERLPVLDGELKVMRSVFINLFLVPGFLVSTAWPYSGGSGTPEDPYQITTAQDLVDLGESSDDYSKCFILTADIDMADRVFNQGHAVIAPVKTQYVDGEPTPVGPFFTGCFNGSGHQIVNLRIRMQTHYGGEYIGLFGGLGPGAVVMDLAILSANMDGFSLGALVGNLFSGAVLNCYSSGIVSGERKIGGLVGQIESGHVSNCYSTVTVTGRNEVGGLVGYNRFGSVLSSYCAGIANGRHYVGGLAGVNGGNISNCYSTSIVMGRNDIGGLVGVNGGSISNCYSTGWMRGSGGGLVGNTGGDGDTITGSFWDTEKSGQQISAGGVGLSSDQMQNVDFFLDAGWDFDGENANGICQFW